MAELGLFSPANPVTYTTPAAAVGATLDGTGQAGGVCQGLTFYPTPPPPKHVKLSTGQDSLQFQPVPDLPPELTGRGFIRAADCAKRRKHKFRNHGEALICGNLYYPVNPWVDCATQRTLMQGAGGQLLLYEHPCLTGYGALEYKAYDLDGNYVCSVFPNVPSPPDPNLPPPNYGQPPGSGGGEFGRPGLPIGISGPTISVGGVNISVGDIGRILTGTGGTPDLAGILGVVAALVAVAGGIKGSLDFLPPGLADQLAPHLGGIGTALDQLVPGMGRQLFQALDTATGKQRDNVADANAFLVGAVPQAVPHWFAALVHAVGSLLKKLLEDYKAAATGISRTVLDIYRKDLEDFGPIGPHNVDQVAARALASAITAGTTAQLAGMGIELVHPIKTLGVQQAIGLLAEFAGFGEIAKPFFGATLRYAIGLPAEHRAAAHFRTGLPLSVLVRQLAAAGHVPPAKYRERLLLDGLPDPYPDAFLEHLYAEITPRALSAFVDGSEADRPWIAEKLRYAGLSPRDAERITKALELKATAPGRTRLVSELLSAHQAGQLEDADLEAGLAGAGLSRTHQAYYLRAAALQRRGKRLEEVAGELVAQYRGDVVGAETTKQLLRGLGMTEDEITVRLTVADLKRNKAQVSAEERAIETEIRTLKAQALKAALVQVRAGFLDVARFLAVGQGMGYSRPYLDVALALARAQGTPKTTAAAPAIGAGALEEAQAKIAALVAQAVQAKQTDRVAALVSLRVLGLPQDLASEIVQLAEALAGPAPFAGDYGVIGGFKPSGAFGTVVAAVVEGLAGIRSPADLVTELLARLGLPGLDRTALTRLIQDLRQLFGGG